jgi:hypothetical protein
VAVDGRANVVFAAKNDAGIAKGPAGASRAASERAASLPLATPVTVQLVSSGTGILRSAVLAGHGVLVS